ncbi:MAG TPA: outer membrane protein assembly factor BamA [Opitutaceae bacterium]|nr:outer membrane protein assembly factor BamA [Opitutaceae bacterium]
MKTTPSNPRRSLLLVWAACCLLTLVGLVPVRAQLPDAGQAPETGQSPGTGHKVGTITVKFVGTANVNEQIVRANMQLHEGGDIDDTILDRDIRNLYKTGLFEFIETKWQQVDARTFNLVVEVTPKFRVFAVRYLGNKKVKIQRLEKETKTRPNTALDDRQVKDDSEKIRDYYQKIGYNQVSVTYRVDRDRSNGFATVIYQIKEGARVKIGNVIFVGNQHFKSKSLRAQMDTKRHWMFSWLTGGGRFKDEQFEDDLDKLRDYYKEDGYLDVEIPEDRVEFNYPKPTELVLVIHVNEGRQYHIGTITFSGNKLHSSALLRRLVKQKRGMVFSPSRLDKDATLIEDFYGKDGYLDTRVRLQRSPNIATGNIDIQYEVAESEKFSVESIVVEGNTKTKSTAIIRELILGPGDTFSTYLMKISKNRLDNTRFFDDVETEPQDTNIPGRRNLRVAVKEGRTGNLTFGAGYSSLERASVFAEISQSNFDLFNPHSLFQGDGQKFRIRLELGQLSSQAIISFEEPWLFQKALGLGVSLYRTSSDYESAYYDEVDLGFTVSLRKHLFELVDATLQYQYQIIEIENVSPNASQVIAADAGHTGESKVSLQLTRDTRDKIISPTSGNYVSFTPSIAGGPLGGQNNYYEFQFDGSQWFQLFEAQHQTLGLTARANVAVTYGPTKILPYYDAFYLGGPDDLRGFEFRMVSPRDVFGEPIGGKTSDMFTAEYSLDIVSPIRFAAFYDIGSVNQGSFDFNPFNYQDDFGVGLRLFVMGAPLSLDYAIPIRGDSLFPNKSGNQFNFSFGTRF